MINSHGKPRDFTKYKADGCDWSDFIPQDKRSYSDKESVTELITLLKKEKND